MSKMDRLRQMREARYEEAAARAGQPATRRAAPVAPPARSVAPPADRQTRSEQAPTAKADPEAAEELCGHRNMGGRTCTRERGHAAKSHRYS